MRIPLLCLTVFISLSPSIVFSDSGWQIKKKDKYGDKTVSAFTQEARATAVVRCQDNALEVYFIFKGEHLDYPAIVQYAVDIGPTVEDRWTFDTSRDKIFVAGYIGLIRSINQSGPVGHPAEIARLMMNGSTFSVSAKRTIASPYIEEGKRSSHVIRTHDAKEKIKAVFDHCGLSYSGLHTEIKGLRKEIAMEIDEWGPRTTESIIEILKLTKLYKGKMETKLDSHLALKIQEIYDSKVGKCRKGLIDTEECEKYFDTKKVDDPTEDMGTSSVIDLKKPIKVYEVMNTFIPAGYFEGVQNSVSA